MPDIILPGLIDVHTHLRVPGGEHKEDFATGTAAALAGGITMILGMPNTTPPLTTPEVMAKICQQVQSDACCDVGLFAGASPEEIEQLPALAPYAIALKIYLNDTFGPLRVEDVPTLRACFQTWPRDKIIAMHAEKTKRDGRHWPGGRLPATCPFLSHSAVSKRLNSSPDAKASGLPVTCEVTPHHLFLTKADAARLGPLGDMRPILGAKSDVAALWEHINDTIDCIATDHAPHTLAEKTIFHPATWRCWPGNLIAIDAHGRRQRPSQPATPHRAHASQPPPHL